VILGGAEGPNGPPELTGDLESARVLYVGRLVKSKGVDDLIAAYKVVSERIPRSRLIIVGDGPERGRLEGLAHELNLSTGVVFRGTLRGEELDEEYAKCTVFAMASKRVSDDPAIETFGLVIVEALMYGKPVVGTLLGGIPEIIDHEVNGLLVPEGRPKELANALIRILTDQDLAGRLHRNALESAEKKFTWAAATDRLLSCYSRKC
jgi:phosphatidylinositol alpha-1,6-mannosyltransferase